MHTKHRILIACMAAMLSGCGVTAPAQSPKTTERQVSVMTQDEMDFPEEFDEAPEDISDWIHIDKSALRFPVRTEGIDGECFTYSVYFKDGINDAKIKTVSDALNAYDFKLIDDDYPGYISVSEEDGKALVYLDLGNTKPQNENRIIQGILLAINDIPDIEKVIINEGLDDFG